MSALAEKIVVTCTPNNTYSLTINGEEFPYWISCDGVAMVVTNDNLPGITITIHAHELEVHHEMR